MRQHRHAALHAILPARCRGVVESWRPTTRVRQDPSLQSQGVFTTRSPNTCDRDPCVPAMTALMAAAIGGVGRAAVATEGKRSTSSDRNSGVSALRRRCVTFAATDCTRGHIPGEGRERTNHITTVPTIATTTQVSARRRAAHRARRSSAHSRHEL